MTSPTSAMGEHRLAPELAFLLKPLRVPFQEWFDKLRDEANRYPSCFDNPFEIPPNMSLLAEYASRANVANIAREMARCWGEEHPDASLLGYDSMKIWPAATLRGPHRLHLISAKIHPTTKLIGIQDLGGSQNIEIRDENGLLVFCEKPTYVRPGSWINVLHMEYCRFLHWRRENEDKPNSLPKPLKPLALT